MISPPCLRPAAGVAVLRGHHGREDAGVHRDGSVARRGGRRHRHAALGVGLLLDVEGVWVDVELVVGELGAEARDVAAATQQVLVQRVAALVWLVSQLDPAVLGTKQQ